MGPPNSIPTFGPGPPVDPPDPQLREARTATELLETLARRIPALPEGLAASATTTVRLVVHEARWFARFADDGSGGHIAPESAAGASGAAPAALPPAATLTWTSEAAFLAMARGELSPTEAFRNGAMKVRGDPRVLFKLKPLAAVFGGGGELRSAAARRGEVAEAEGGAAGGAAPAAAAGGRLLPRAAWVPDAASRACTACTRPFGVLARRHHCRFCGRIYCAACSSVRVRGHRACHACTAAICGAATIAPVRLGDGGGGAGSEMLRSSSAGNLPMRQRGGAADAGTSAPSDAVEAEVQRLRVEVDKLTKRLHEKEEAALKAAALQLSAAEVLGWWAAPCAFLLLALAAAALGWAGTATLLLVLLLGSGCVAACPQRSVLLRRRLCVYATALVCIARTKVTQMRADRMSAEYGDALWEHTHAVNAELIYRTIIHLRGYLLKIGQYMASRPEMLPEVFVRQLSKLQDRVPPTPYAEVVRTVERELGMPLSHIFAEFDPVPLASASIAQVHRAVLKQKPGEEGVQVAVKVMHDGIGTLVKQDMANWSIISKWMHWAGAPDMEQVVEEFRKETLHELDFAHEAGNLATIDANLQRSGLHIRVPEVIDRVSSKHLLVMQFVEGIKITEANLPEPERKALATTTFRCTLGVLTGHTYRWWLPLRIKCSWMASSTVTRRPHADMARAHAVTACVAQHPGNIFVEESMGTSLPVLLDFGMVKRIPQHVRLAFAKMLHAGANRDFAALLDSFTDMGLELSRDDPEKDLQAAPHPEALVRRPRCKLQGLFYLFRETVPTEQGRAEMQQRMANYRELRAERHREKKAGSRNKEKTIQHAPSVESFPSELIMFGRVIMMLRGLCGEMGVGVNLMEIFSKCASRALSEAISTPGKSAVDPPGTTAPPLWPSPGATAGRSNVEQQPLRSPPPVTPLQTKVRAMVEAAVQSYPPGLGLQVVVLARGERVVDVAAGQLGQLDKRPVTSETRFRALAVSQGILGLVALALADAGALDLDASLRPWCDCDSTVRQLLAFSSGVESMPPPATFAATRRFAQKDVAAGWSELRGSLRRPLPAPDGIALRMPAKVEAESPATAAAVGERYAMLSVPYELQHLALAWGWVMGALVEDAVCTHVLPAAAAATAERTDDLTTEENCKSHTVMATTIAYLARVLALPADTVTETMAPLLEKVLSTMDVNNSPASGAGCQAPTASSTGGPAAAMRVCKANIGGVTIGGVGAWNKDVWLSARSISDPAVRTWEPGVDSVLPRWVQAHPTCLDPRVLEQLDGMALPGMQACASAGAIAALYGAAICHFAIAADADSAVPPLPISTCRELADTANEAWTFGLCGNRIALAMGQRVFHLMALEQQEKPHARFKPPPGRGTDTGTMNGGRGCGSVAASDTSVGMPGVVKGYGHEAFGGTALVMAIPSEQLVLAVTSNVAGVDTDDSGAASGTNKGSGGGPERALSSTPLSAGGSSTTSKAVLGRQIAELVLAEVGRGLRVVDWDGFEVKASAVGATPAPTQL